MTETRDLLIELGTEELPPKALATLSAAFEQGIEAGIKDAELAFTELKAYAAPRRLAVTIEGLAVKQQDRLVERRGPAVASAFDDQGQPTKALQGFARSCGVAVEELDTMETDKGAWLVFKQQQSGAETTELLAEIVEKTLQSLPIPKRMRWGDLPGEFVRPVHWLVVLFGDQVVPMTLLGVTSGRDSYGHRFHHPEAIEISAPQSYAEQLKSDGYVMADREQRKQTIRDQVMAEAEKLGGQAVINADLLDEVTGLVEWPVALSGSYDKRFLELPAEALVSSMEEHQKYFAVTDAEGHLLPHFITICNIESQDPAQVIAGNERVILPRLSDAAFFWETDRKAPLIERLDKLSTIVFQNKLGTVHDKVQRVAKLAANIATQIDGDAALTERAALLAKCDLVTEMVGEFPDLQGIMGRYYAELDGEHEQVSQAIDEQYLPRFAGDKLPVTKTGQALSIAEKLDTLVGLFAVGQPPTGVKDPFALRRATLGILRIIIENDLALDLEILIRQALANVADVTTAENCAQDVLQYCYERLRGYASEQGYQTAVFEAVLATNTTKPLDFIDRLKAVTAFNTLEQAEALAAANKRIGNILRKNEGEQIAEQLDQALLVENSEQVLAEQVTAVQAAIAPLLAKSDYKAVLEQLADLRDSVDAFFDQVMVMADDLAVRKNRLALLNQIRALFLQVADISHL